MIIRSQDGKKLTDDLSLEIFRNEWTEIYEIRNKSVGVIGEYSSLEKSLEVFDLICDRYKHYEKKYGFIFKMPREDDPWGWD